MAAPCTVAGRPQTAARLHTAAAVFATTAASATDDDDVRSCSSSAGRMAKQRDTLLAADQTARRHRSAAHRADVVS